MKTLHVVGDSISIHYGPYLAKHISPYYQYSRKEGQVDDMDSPIGPNGGDSSMVLAYLRECIAAGMYWDILVINCGLHDIKRYDGRLQIPLADYEQNLLDIHLEARSLADYVIWIRSTPVIDEIHNSRMSDFQRFSADLEQYSRVADSITSISADLIIDLNTLCHGMGGAEIFEDHVHFTDEARKIQGAFIAGQIVGYLAQHAI